MDVVNKKSIVLSTYNTVGFNLTANLPLFVDANFTFKFQSLVQLKRVYLGNDKGLFIHAYGAFLDLNGNLMQTIPVTSSNPDWINGDVPSWDLVTGQKLEFDDLKVGGIRIASIVSPETISDVYMSLNVELLVEDYQKIV